METAAGWTNRNSATAHRAGRPAVTDLKRAAGDVDRAGVDVVRRDNPSARSALRQSRCAAVITELGIQLIRAVARQSERARTGAAHDNCAGVVEHQPRTPLIVNRAARSAEREQAVNNSCYCTVNVLQRAAVKHQVCSGIGCSADVAGGTAVGQRANDYGASVDGGGTSIVVETAI